MRRPVSQPPLTFIACACLAIILSAGSCSSVPNSTDTKEASRIETDLQNTPLGQMAIRLAADKTAEESGFVLLDRGHEALAWRLFMADQATRSIDAQYFLWKNDRVGRLAIQHLLDAAERGVRVRMLIDDSMTESDPLYLAKLSAHPNAEVRLYKPFGPKHKSFVLRWLDFAADFSRLNRRMHNKLYIADNSLMISGGRNIGDDYFEYLAPDVFRGRDLLGAGPIAEQSGASFDMYWNSQWAVPIEMAVDPVPTEAEAIAFRQLLDRDARDPGNYPPGYQKISSIEHGEALLASEVMWGKARLLYDTVPGENGEPEVPRNASDAIGAELRKVTDAATDELLIESAYLILSDSTLDYIQKASNRGLHIKAMTNSLAANNHTTAFVGYRKQRGQMIDIFTELYEYRPDATSQTALYADLAPGEPPPHFGLHAKTAVYDRRTVFVGSYNIDPRSQNLNTEVGLLVESAELGAAVAASILGDMGPGNSWQVRRNAKGKTEWVTIENGKEVVEADSEPLTSAGRKLEADIAQPFTPESQM
jgi:putative cardiolipin synthase